jgi:hypothetical protein
VPAANGGDGQSPTPAGEDHEHPDPVLATPESGE